MYRVELLGRDSKVPWKLIPYQHVLICRATWERFVTFPSTSSVFFITCGGILPLHHRKHGSGESHEFGSLAGGFTDTMVSTSSSNPSVSALNSRHAPVAQLDRAAVS